MNPERWKQIDEIFDAALELEPSPRAAFLAARCGADEELKREVEALLQAQAHVGDFIETSAIKVAARALAGETVFTRVKKQVGPYKIISLLGRGGMGEVHLAEDTRLARKVALKILPPPFVADRRRVRRFEREARAASALNHPNIITIYEIGQSADTHYIATEYVDGQTLRERLRAGRLKLQEALAVAVQVAEALSAAHAAGITHRDVKTENIMLRRDGYVKVLDFGLVKLTESADGNADFDPFSTGTQPGLVMGTVRYMSPEQALGQTVDQRTDIWSLGVVLYEMLTGQKPFDGSSQPAIFAAILHHAPTPATNLNAEVPAELDRILQRALEKDRELRYQTAADLQADLQRLQREREAFPELAPGAIRRVGRTTSHEKYRRMGVVLAACAALALAFGTWFVSSRVPPEIISHPPGSRWGNALHLQLREHLCTEFFPCLAPDGKSFIYVSRATGNLDLHWQRVGGKNAVNLTKDSPADDTQPAFSPDGNYIAFRSERAPKGIYVMEATSENVRRVSDIGFHPSWSPDGKELVVSEESGSGPEIRNVHPSALWIVNVSTGTKHLLTKGDAVQPHWSPHGHRIAYWFTHRGGQRDIATIAARGGEPVPVTVNAVADDTATDWNPVWSPDGKYLYWASDRGGSMNFWRVSVDEQTGRVLGEPEAVITPSQYSRHLTFSRDGKRMAYVQTERQSNLQAVGFDPVVEKVRGEPVWLTQGDRELYMPELSPDGAWYLLRWQNRNREDLVMLSNDGTGWLQLTDDRFKERQPHLSPDGRRVAFTSDRSGRWEIWTINTDGTGLQQVTFTSGQPGQDVYCPVWSPDGARLVFTQKTVRPYMIDMNRSSKEQTPQPLPRMENFKGDFTPWSWSPDGTKLAGWIRGLGQDHDSGLVLYSFVTQSYERVALFGTHPVWLSDSRRLLFNHNDAGYLVDSQTKRVKEIISGPPSQRVQNIGISHDDRRLYYSLLLSESDIWLLSLD